MLGALLSEDLTTGAIQLRLDGQAEPFQVLQNLRSVEQPSGLKVRFAGSQVIFETLWDSQRRIVAILSPMAILILFVVHTFFSVNFACFLNKIFKIIS